MGITAAEPARILGGSRNHVYRLAREGRLPRDGEANAWGRYDRETVEALSLAWLPQYAHGHAYWATTNEAADVLGVTVERMRQLTNGRMPVRSSVVAEPASAALLRLAGWEVTTGRRTPNGARGIEVTVPGTKSPSVTFASAGMACPSAARPGNSVGTDDVVRTHIEAAVTTRASPTGRRTASGDRGLPEAVVLLESPPPDRGLPWRRLIFLPGRYSGDVLRRPPRLEV